jgi:hypothetical protein
MDPLLDRMGVGFIGVDSTLQETKLASYLMNQALGGPLVFESPLIARSAGKLHVQPAT